MARFLLPEESISLKLVFDNVRNYLLCGALAAVGVALAKLDGATITNTFDALPLWPWSLKVIFLLLLAANAVQTVLIINRATRGVGNIPKDLRPNWRRWQRLTLQVVILLLIFPIVAAAFQLLPTLILWALAGGTNPKGP